MNETTQVFRALADETRLRIIALLMDGELCVCDLVAVLELPQSTVSRHLACLRHAGMVSDRRRGQWMFYRLAAADGLRAALVELLGRQRQAIPRAGEDRRRLRKHLADKQRRVAC